MRHGILERATTAAAVVALAQMTSAQAIHLVVEGDALPGAGTVTEVVAVAINDAGDWIASVATDQFPPGKLALVRNGAVVLKYGDPVPGYVPGFTFESTRALDLNASASFAWAATTGPSVFTAASGVYVDQTPLALAGAVVTAPGITPGTTYIGFYDVVLDDAGGAIAHAYMNDPAILGIHDNVLLRLVPQPSGGVVETDLVKRGDLLPGQTAAVQELSEVPNGLAVNDSGAFVYVATMADSSTAVYRELTLLGKAGGISPVFGRTWQSFSRMPVAIGEGGDTAFGGRLIGDLDSDQLLVWNEIKVAQEGDALPAVAPFALEDLGFAPSFPVSSPLRLTASGRIVWYASWDDPDTTRDAGLFLDHELVVQEGVTRAGGVRVADLAATTVYPPHPMFDVSESGELLAFRAVLSDGRSGAFLLPIAGEAKAMPDCTGNPGTLTANLAPKLGSSLALFLDNGQANGVNGFVLLSALPAPGWPPCGVALPGVGEVLIGLAPPDPLLVIPGLYPWQGFLVPAVQEIPDDLSLLGLHLYAQGVFLDLAGVAVAEPVRLTNGVEVTIGL